ncbi:MAG: deoxyribodipyrimidine photolyase [Rhodospirillaceae bacterium]|nr:deoxyribodipyrimidine photolyase [Rhodospirillaceae bacterium]
MMDDVAVCWFRQDLRLSDNPALSAAAEHAHVLPVYILDTKNTGAFAIGAASRWWLHWSLHALNQSLGGNLSLYQGDPHQILEGLVHRLPVTAVHWNRCYEPWPMERDTKIKSILAERDIRVESHNGSLLWEPWDIKKDDGTPYKVFTPFYRKGCLKTAAPRKPLEAPKDVSWLRDENTTLSLDELDLQPKFKWDEMLAPHWTIGEEGANDRLQKFIRTGLAHYKDGRNLPAEPFVSRLSPHLRFGEISPNQAWYTATSQGDGKDIDHFCSELGWREFSYSLLYHNPDLAEVNLQKKFDEFPWSNDPVALKAWQKGETGVPMVDAGMRELWQTGFMHNRVRMITGSFLIKNLLLHWHNGERWFWDTLVDADPASNSASWQWVAGCGADAAPYFRIFNPVTQGQKFDPHGDYVRRYVPELAALPNKYLFNPWEAPDALLLEANVELGVTYPKPIVDLKASRERALAAFKSLSQGT